ncbi:TonB-dependent receptor [Sphingomonas sp.]|uniref:TonB-dependent receptor n=1 Tax=Sphingomonas sp. TaxID=28214 RepID=UPI003D6C824D
MKGLLTGSAAAGLIGLLTGPAIAQSAPEAQRESAQDSQSQSAQDSQNASGSRGEGDIVVTARRFSERLQDVPDSVTAFTTERIEKAGIQSFGDFASLTPNLNFSDFSSFSAGASTISLRGIGNGQQGWTSVSFLVDGVPIDSLDSLSDGTLTDIAQIEVLRGPQSAIYGFNAIAGAINITTKRPTNDFEGMLRAQYATGDDRNVLGVASGPIVRDKVLFRIEGYKRKRDGLLTDPSSGRQYDPIDQTLFKGKLLLQPTDNLSFELTGTYNHVISGAGFQEKFPSPVLIEDFSSALNSRRRFLGKQDHEVYSFSARGQYDAGFADLISISAYTRTKQTIQNSICYDNPDNPVVPATFVLGPLGTPVPAPPGVPSCVVPLAVFGSAAPAFAPVDLIFDGADNYRTFFQDLRLQSRDSGKLRWVIGGNYLERTAVNGFDTLLVLAPASGAAGCADGFGLDSSKCGPLINVFPSWHERKDRWWGIYGQVAYDISPKLELTVAGRYDRQRYRDTQYTDRNRTIIIQVVDAQGILRNSQEETADRFQPKVQLSYKWSPDLMTYFTFSEGFRAGFFNTGAFSAPEHTENYEAGIKSSFNIGGVRAVINANVFHIDYSNQQFSTVIAAPPFRTATTIPKTAINGGELEATFYPTRSFSIATAVGYLDAKVANGGGRAPYTPRWTASVSADWSHRITHNLSFLAHADYRYRSLTYLFTGNSDPNPSRQFVNLRAGISGGMWTLTGFVKNLTNERDRVFRTLSFPNGGFGRAADDSPRTGGVELKLDF